MSLNKITNSSDYLQKQYLNIGCNDIKCTSLEVSGQPVSKAVTGKYDATMTSSVPNTDMTNGFVYWEAIDNQLKLTFSRIHQLTNTTSANTFTIDLPVGYTSTPLSGVGGLAYATDGTRVLDMTVSAIDVTGTKFVVQTSGSNTLSIGTAYFNGTFVVEI